MKVALVLSGLARNVKEGFETYWEHIIKWYDTDVYLHAWKDDEWDEVGKVYKNPKVLTIHSPRKFTEDIKGIKQTGDLSLPKQVEFDTEGSYRQLPMFYSWQEVWKTLKLWHVKDNKITSGFKENYDCIIRSRYDLGNYILDLDKIDLDKINVSGHHWKGTDVIDDNILITNQDNADLIFSDIYDSVLKLGKEKGSLDIPEKTFTQILKNKGLYSKVYKNPQIKFDLLRKHIFHNG